MGVRIDDISSEQDADARYLTHTKFGPYKMHVSRIVIMLAIISSALLLPKASGKKDESCIREVCNVTLYKAVCIQNLARFAVDAGMSPVKWATAAMTVAIRSTAKVNTMLRKFDISNSTGNIFRFAVADCVETFDDCIDRLITSRSTVGNLTRDSFESQMLDAKTWLSAALTDADTCQEGLDQTATLTKKVMEFPTIIMVLQRRITRAYQLTSIALALVNQIHGI